MDKDRIKRLIVITMYDRVYNTILPYEAIISNIYDDFYRHVGKMPIAVFFDGLIGVQAQLNGNKVDFTLDLIKEVVIDILEVGGFEATFTDQDWDNLKYIPHPKWDGWQILNTDKKAMFEFFEY